MRRAVPGEGLVERPPTPPSVVVSVERMVTEARQIERERALLEVRRLLLAEPVRTNSRTAYGLNDIPAEEYRGSMVDRIDGLLVEAVRDDDR